MREIVLRFQPAAGHQRISDADRGGVAEGNTNIEIIIPEKKRIVNDAENIPLVSVPIFIGKLSGDLFKLFLYTVFAGDIVTALQHGGNSLFMLLLVLPRLKEAGTLRVSRIRHIKNIPEPWPVPGHIYKGDALTAAPDIPPHTPVPDIITGAGGGLRALGVYHELFRVWILI